jgi:anti-anti-sigma factor
MEPGDDKRGQVAVVAPVGRIDANTSGDLERTLFRRLAAGETRMVIDMSGIDYVSSAGLRVLLRAANTVREKRGRLVLCSLGRSVREVFDLAGLMPVFTIEDSRDLAVARAAEGV